MNEVLNCLETRRSCRAYTPGAGRAGGGAAGDPGVPGIYAPSRAMGRQSRKARCACRTPPRSPQLERLNGGVLGSPDAHPFYGAPAVCVVLADAAAVSPAVEDGSLTSSAT